MEQQKKKDTSDNHEVDPFTAFMFGKPRINDDIKNVNPFQQMIGYLGETIEVIRKTETEEDQQVNGTTQ